MVWFYTTEALSSAWVSNARHGNFNALSLLMRRISGIESDSAPSQLFSGFGTDRIANAQKDRNSALVPRATCTAAGVAA